MSDPTEIERKFIVTNPQAVFKSSTWLSVENLEQGYLAREDGYVVRVRTSTEPPQLDVFPEPQSTRGWICVKTKGVGLVRKEFEYEVPYLHAKSMLELTTNNIVKTRYKILDEFQQQWDVDFFTKKDEIVIIAEIELADEHQQIQLPPWVGEEVSSNPKYYNSNM